MTEANGAGSAKRAVRIGALADLHCTKTSQGQFQPVLALLESRFPLLAMLFKLSGGRPLSISRLTAGTDLSRQAVTKHLRVLANAGIVRNLRVGRESLFEFEPQPIEQARTYLDRISQEWDDALARLRSHLEE